MTDTTPSDAEVIAHTQALLADDVEVTGNRFAFPSLYNTDTFGTAVVHVVGVEDKLGEAIAHAIEALIEGEWAWKL